MYKQLSIIALTIALFSFALLSSSSKQSLRRKLTIAKDQKTWKQELLFRLSRIRDVCGELCSIETLDDFNRKAQNINGYPTFTANIDCDRLMGSDDIDASDLTFPTEIPEELVPFYILNDLIPIILYLCFFKDAYLD